MLGGNQRLIRPSPCLRRFHQSSLSGAVLEYIPTANDKRPSSGCLSRPCVLCLAAAGTQRRGGAVPALRERGTMFHGNYVTHREWKGKEVHREQTLRPEGQGRNATQPEAHVWGLAVLGKLNVGMHEGRVWETKTGEEGTQNCGKQRVPQ